MTNRKMWFSICATFLVSTSIVLSLFLMSADLRRRQGSFIREFPPHAADESDTLNLKYATYYMSGATEHTLYLGNYEKPLHLVSVNLNSMDTAQIALSVEGVMDQKFWSPRVKVDSPYFYFVDGAVPRIYRGDVQSWHAVRYPYDSGYYFNDIVPMSTESYILKTVSAATLENVIGRLRSDAPRYVHNDSLLEKQVDGRFCTDGMLHYNRRRAELLYLYRYRNQFMVMDTTLQLKYRGRTIDTTSVALIRTADLLEAKQRVLAAPAQSVNGSSCVSGNYLFVQSPTLASNEHKDAQKKATVIDVYHLDDGGYRFSFYIFHYQHQKAVEQFNVCGNILVILYEGVIVTYRLRERYLNNEFTSW